jgi:hypothetical protein
MKPTKCKGCLKCRYGIAGAGVLLYDGRTRELIMVRNHSRKYTDCGGSYQSRKHIIISACASMELYEETRGTVAISSKYLQKCVYIDLPAGRHVYRMYYVSVNLPGQPMVLCRDYYKIDPSMLPMCFRETNAMTRFSIKQFKNEHKYTKSLSSSKSTNCGKCVNIDGRVLNGIVLGLIHNII